MLDFDHIEKIINDISEQKTAEERCTCISEPLVTLQGSLVCTQCGFTSSDVFVDSTDNINMSKTRAYQRINHYKEHLKNACGIIGIEAMSAELERSIRQACAYNPRQLRKALRHLNLYKYYDKIPYLAYRLFGIQPLHMPYMLQEHLLNLFRRFNVCYVNLKERPQRRNMFNYNYLTHHFLKILLGQENDFLDYFPLLKNKKKLQDMDRIMQLICNQINVPFYPSYMYDDQQV